MKADNYNFIIKCIITFDYEITCKPIYNFYL